MKLPKKPTGQWSLADVQTHLEFAVNLEMWTIPYYMTAMYSIEQSDAPQFRLLQSIVHQEMLHAEFAANVYNAFQPTKKLALGPYVFSKESGVPHLNFAKDPEAVAKYGEPDATLGGLDMTRISTMCMIELPETMRAAPAPGVSEYATIGDFYEALSVGMKQNVAAVVGGNNQVDIFANFYRNLEVSTVTDCGEGGLAQAVVLIEAITEQGEGCGAHTDVPSKFQNTADGYNESWSHFRKFNSVRDGLLVGGGPPTYQADAAKRGTPSQKVLARNFTLLLQEIENLFNGQSAPDFGSIMPTVGANILTCWRNGVIPQYS